MKRLTVLRVASLFVLASAGCSSSSPVPGSGGQAGGSGGATHGSGGGGASGSGGNGGASGGASGSGGSGGASGSGGSGGTSGSGGSAAGSGGRGSGGSSIAEPSLVTSADGAYWKTGTLTAVTSASADVTVDDGSPAQTWEGFGGPFEEMGWSYLQGLSATDRDRAMKLLFDATDGAHLGMGRVPMGASDYALQRYTDDETANDTALASFSISRDMKYLIPYVKAAQAINGSLRLWASPWTPPTWMKTNTGNATGVSCAMVGSTAFDGGCMRDTAANLATLAQYFVAWIQAYAGQGITIDTVAPQEQPTFAQGYPSALWTPALYTKFIGQFLGPALVQAQLGTKIMLGSMPNGDNGASSRDMQIVQAVMADASAKSFVKVVGVEWTMLDLYEGKTGGVTPATFMTGSLPVWATLHKCGNYPFNPSGYPLYVEPAPNNLAYAVESWGYIRNAIKAGVTAYNAAHLVLDTLGKGNDTTRNWSQNALLVVDTSAQALILTPTYYVFRHFSQFVDPGAQVLGTSGGDAAAFKNPDGAIVAVIYNSGAAKTFTVALGGKTLQFPMPAAGWATVNYKP
jgi:glucosylceramidase